MIFLFIILIISSAFFSASEISYFNIKKHQKISNATRILLNKPRELLTFILISNTLINIAIGSLAANYTLNVLSNHYLISTERLLFIEVIIVTLVVLIFGEIIPKTFAIKRSVNFANIISHPMYYFFLVSKPLFFIFYKFSD